MGAERRIDGDQIARRLANPKQDPSAVIGDIDVLQVRQIKRIEK